MTAPGFLPGQGTRSVSVFLSEDSEGYWWAYTKRGPWRGPHQAAGRLELEVYLPTVVSFHATPRFEWTGKIDESSAPLVADEPASDAPLDDTVILGDDGTIYLDD